jgi:DisA bacterial checkpoint controller nucleotide-binding
MVGEVSSQTGRLVLDALYQQLLLQGLHYFLPAGQLEIVGSAPASGSQLEFRETTPDGLFFDWLGSSYALTSHRNFSDHEQRMVRSIAQFLSTRYELFFDREIVAQNAPIIGGLPEDRYVSTFLEARVYGDARAAAILRDRVAEAIEVLRISALSSYEDKRISTGALLFGAFPDVCHALPSRPAGALPYASELTSIRSFQRICDGLRTLALVDASGYMVELIDVQEWAQPFSEMELPVPSARRYRTHSQATLCGGHLCIVLTPNGEIKIFGEGVQLFSFLDGRWHLTDAVSKFEVWEQAIGNNDLASRTFSAALNLAEHRRGGMFVVLDDPGDIREVVRGSDLLESDRKERIGAKNQLHYLLRKTSVAELSSAVLESIAQIDGSVVLDRDSNLLAFGAILRQRAPLHPDDEDVGEGGRTSAAIGVSQLGNVLMISEGGQLFFYQKGHCIWTL